MEIDPVCGMELNNIESAPRIAYNGRMYYFCCPKCKSLFVKAPESYVDFFDSSIELNGIKPDKCDCDKSMLYIKGYRF
ncbi:hypothetical protein MROS_0799 [Melioribacter roseus P3M-2]|uniref:TRASH domain-containing protein n=1 Tax=Melioribacter roseus (strain DSM 23840 / JCM 17771 / VKM B-2668 / P3M-2) TaxID=1191523 RepID=I6Z4H6_MELRP|nr:YHS domain-containing protein [Melioribacter roseus]AFN74040.1 hypothetical protein MROS_0799 [Melioribacter roseus P3M-2]